MRKMRLVLTFLKIFIMIFRPKNEAISMCSQPTKVWKKCCKMSAPGQSRGTQLVNDIMLLNKR